VSISDYVKCYMCNSKNTIQIEEPVYIPYTFDNGKEVMIYPNMRCLNCGAEFDIKIKKE
jgi:hypothetical protein